MIAEALYIHQFKTNINAQSEFLSWYVKIVLAYLLIDLITNKAIPESTIVGYMIQNKYILILKNQNTESCTFDRMNEIKEIIKNLYMRIT